MAQLWSDIQAVLPASEPEFTLNFSEKIEPSLVNILKQAKHQLYDRKTTKSWGDSAQIILDFSWEKLNTGTWRDVDKEWRRVYSYGCLFKATALCCGELSQSKIQGAIKTCDMGLLMGASILDNVLQKLVRLLQDKTKAWQSRHAESSEEPERKVYARSLRTY